MKFNLKELIAGGPARLRYVLRYSTSRVQHPESVAEHSYFVALYCLFIGHYASQEGHRVDFETLLSRAILHDLEEARSGDFPRLFKHSSTVLKQMLDGVSREALSQLLGKVVGKGTDLVGLCSVWECAKADDLEGAILEFADFLSVLGYMMHEAEGGNQTIKNHVEDMKGYFSMFEVERFDFIRPLVKQATLLMKETFPNEYTVPLSNGLQL